MVEHKAHKEPDSHLYSEVNNLRKGAVEVDQDEIDHAKLNNSIWGVIGKSKKFEYTTLTIIVMNAAFIGYDSDFSARKIKPENLYDCAGLPAGDCYQFIIFENFFAVYFTAEVVIRFFAYKRKIDGLKDPWFVFDSVLVLFMVIETWILPIIGASGPLAQLSVLRLLRLLRITRMAKLMRFFPELQIIVKGMVAAVRSVASTAVLLILVLYVFAILFTSEYHQGTKADEDLAEHEAEFLFGSLMKSMRYLFIMGTILDDITLCCNNVRGSSKSYMIAAFIAFVLISSFTMLNMLIGILCEVVCATGEGQRNTNTEANVREAITGLFQGMDKDKNGEITREEFLCMKRDPDVMKALKELEVKPKHFEMYAELMFKQDAEGKVEPFDFDKTVNMILRLRPGTKVSALDFASFNTTVQKNHDRLKKHVDTIEKMASALTGQDVAARPHSPFLETPKTLLESSASRSGTPVDGPPILDKTSDQQILAELQRRLGIKSTNKSAPEVTEGMAGNTESTGPAANHDTVYAAQLPEFPDVQDWSPETYTC